MNQRPQEHDVTAAHEHRHVDRERAELGGEAADQRAGDSDDTFPAPREGPEHRPADRAVVGDDGGTTYYDQPLIKTPIWIWSVPAYFYTGGVAAGAAIVGAAAQLAGRERYAGLIRGARWLATGGTGIGTVLLVIDLGRPSRFLNMLRVFRPSSAMSVGSWTLAAASTAAGASATLPLTGTRAGRVLGDVAGLGAGALAPVLGTYTAVLVSDTAVPVWQATRRSLPRYFAGSALTAATAALDLLPLDGHEHTVTRRIGTVAKAGELVAAQQVKRDADEVERVGRPLHQGLGGALWRTAEVATAASLAISLAPVPPRWRRRRRIASAVLATAGSIAGRFAVFHAGKLSSRDPRASFDQQRAGHGAAESDGRAGVVGADGRRATDPA